MVKLNKFSQCIDSIASHIQIQLQPILRVDPKAKKYTGALCGLGFDKEAKRPIYLENDIEDVFEVDFNSADLKKVSLLLLKPYWAHMNQSVIEAYLPSN